MARIRTTCPACGEVDLIPDRIVLKIEAGGRRGAYSFTCPNCSSIIAKPADKKIIGLLQAAGVAESVDAPLPTPPPPLTLDDAIDFHRELEERGIEGFFGA